MANRLLVTGAGGFVGGSIVAQAGPGWQVHAICRTAPPTGGGGIAWHALDLCDLGRLEEVFAEIRPDAVIHSAAMADIDRCQADPSAADRVNVRVTEQIARLCSANGARLVYLSTDTVFDGARGMYREDDVPHPVNHYGETKLRAEQAVAAIVPGAAVARLALVMGLPMLGPGNSFLPKTIASWREGSTVSAPQDEIRTPVDVVTLGRALLELAGSAYAGIVHLAGNEAMSRFDMARRIAHRLGFAEDLVAPTSAAAPNRAPRPRDVSLDNSRARGALVTPMLGLDAALDLVLTTRTGD